MTNLSYVCGVSGEPLLYKTVGAAMLEQIRPKAPLLRHAILTDDTPRAGFLRYRDVESSGTAEDLDRVRQLRPHERRSPDSQAILAIHLF